MLTFLHKKTDAEEETEERVMQALTDDEQKFFSQSIPIVFILCLDESGSMSGQPHLDLTKAYNKFISRRVSDQGNNERIVVIPFHHTARFLAGPEPVDIHKAPILDRDIGGTKFCPALEKAEQSMGHASVAANTQFVMLFMSDGMCEDPTQSKNKILQLINKFGARFVCHTVGFGSGTKNSPVLTAMVAGGGRFHYADTGEDLVKTFSRFAKVQIV
jgi:Mg-chelatase subunit ChlD